MVNQRFSKPSFVGVVFMIVALEKIQAITIWKWVVVARETFLG
jgi:hypothetical protein